jgi:N-formylglutamate deformylase
VNSTAPYRLSMPETVTTGVVVCSPHSGRDYPPEMLRRTVLDMAALRSSEDAFVDRLLADVPSMGAPLLCASTPRAWLDLNRGPEELDPALVQGIARGALSPRVSSGLGVIPRVVAQGRPIYAGKITREEAHARIDAVWRPYHACLGQLLDHARARFGRAVLVDCHSMPHEAIEGLGGGARGAAPEIVLGDRFGASAEAGIVEGVEAAFASRGFRVGRNAPFAGAFTAQHYGRPSRGQHAVQIEIDRAIYMDEARIEPLPDFEDTRRRIAEALDEVCLLGRGEGRLAAE